MDEFRIWFLTGMEHILDLSGYDHILFVTLLVLTFPFDKWKKLVALITAFTIGHSISLALSITNTIHLAQPLTEFFIAFSILVTAVYNLVNYKRTDQKNQVFILFIIVFFGLIHGMGFSYALRSMLGHEQSVFFPLFYFNLGLEVGQLIIVAIVLIFSLLSAFVFKFPYHLYKLILICLIGIVALKITVERLLDLF